MILPQKIEQLLVNTIETMGYQLSSCNVFKKKQSLFIKVCIDSPNGITAYDCGEVSQQITRALAVESILSEDYALEVSSPGKPKTLKTREDYQNFLDRQIKVRLKAEDNDSKVICGKLKEVLSDKIMLVTRSKKIFLTYEEIAETVLD